MIASLAKAELRREYHGYTRLSELNASCPPFLGDKKEHSFRETLDALARDFNLSQAELRDLLPSGKQPMPSLETSLFCKGR